MILIIGAFFYWNGNRLPAGPGSLQVAGADANIGANVLKLLNQIKSLKIDTTLFENKAYQTLQDNTVQIPPVSVGRQNPFAPIPGTVVNSPSKTQK
jgi:hypothetical protein